MKLDSVEARRQTVTTMTRSAHALAAPTPLAAWMLVLGLVVFTVIVILPL